MDQIDKSVEMDSKQGIHLPTIREDIISIQNHNHSQSSTSESPSSLSSSFDSSDQEEQEDGKLKIPGPCVYTQGAEPKTAPVTSFNRNMFCFTRSISALNSMTFSMGVLRAKNAFKKKLSQDHLLTPADYKDAGGKLWKDIANTYKISLSFADMDFSDLEKDEPDTRKNTVLTSTNGTSLPPPPPPLNGTPSIPPPPPTSGNIGPPPPPPVPPTLMPRPPPPPSPQTAIQSSALPISAPPPPPPPPSVLKTNNLPLIKFEEKCVLVQRSESQANPKPPPKLVKLHWRPVPHHCLSDTIWQNLPNISCEKSKFETLFTIEEKTRKHSNEIISKPKELLVLDTNRSNQINIGIKSLPSTTKLKVLIEEMDDKIITREGVEKLQSLMPSDEEIAAIKEAQKENSDDIPLGTAEQFLLLLHSISGLECRLKLWAFKVDFKAMEKDICEPLKTLKDGMLRVRESRTFAKILSLTLEVGNVLNSSQTKGFQLDYLSKLSWVKDTMTKKTLLYHIMKELITNDPLITDLSTDFAELVAVSRTDFDQLETNLAGMEEECVNSLGYMKLSARYSNETSDLVSLFLTNAAERIMSMKTVMALVIAEYSRFLSWLGIQAHMHKDYPPKRTAAILVDFAKETTEVRKMILTEIMKENKKKDKMRNLDRSKSAIDKGTPKAHRIIRRSGKSLDDKNVTPNPRADGLEAFLDAAAVDLKKTKRRRSKKITLEDVDISTL